MLLQIQNTAATVTTNAAEAVTQTTEKISILDFAIKGGVIMIPLALLLVIAIYVFIDRFIAIRKAANEDSNFMHSIRDYIMNDRLDSAKALCKSNNTPIARMIEKGLNRLGRPLSDINAAIENVGNLEIAKLEKNISLLATAAGAGPMIGFFGTVVGMVQVFFDMAAKGNNIDVITLSGGMYVAMITTVGGLIVGITAYILYNYLVSRIQRLVFTLEAHTTEFMDLLHEPIK